MQAAPTRSESFGIGSSRSSPPPCSHVSTAAQVLLDEGLANDEAHDAVKDAQKSVKLFHLRQPLDPGALRVVQQQLLDAPRAPSFAQLNPSYDGVCMGNRKTCTCGAPWFG